MSASARKVWTQQEFFDWAETREERYEFDGFAPVAMTGGMLIHNAICQNIWGALRERLRGSGCRPLGPDAGVSTVGNAVRYPDALVTCSKFEADSRLTLEPVVVFEVLSPSSGRIDRIIKVQEYLAVASIRRYVIVESAFSGVTTLEQQDGRWLSAALGSEDVLQLPELGLAIPVSEFYEDITFPAPAGPP